jgi:hypothetical protein
LLNPCFLATTLNSPSVSKTCGLAILSEPIYNSVSDSVCPSTVTSKLTESPTEIEVLSAFKESGFATEISETTLIVIEQLL